MRKILARASFILSAILLLAVSCSKDKNSDSDPDYTNCTPVETINVSADGENIDSEATFYKGESRMIELTWGPSTSAVTKVDLSVSSGGNIFDKMEDKKDVKRIQATSCKVKFDNTGNYTIKITLTYITKEYDNGDEQTATISKTIKVKCISGERTYDSVTDFDLLANSKIVEDTLFVMVGETKTLTVDKTPKDNTMLTSIVIESASLPTAAILSSQAKNYTIEGKNAGETSAKVTVKFAIKTDKKNNVTKEGTLTKTYPVVVTKKVVVPTAIALSVDGENVTELNMEKGQTKTVKVVITPENADITGRTFSVSDKNILSVDESGNVTAVGSGNATLTCTVTYTNEYGRTASLSAKMTIKVTSPNIQFADANVKKICVARWDTNGDGELSEDEALAVKDIGSWEGHTEIKSFEELAYFKNLEMIPDRAFVKCDYLTKVKIPESVKEIGDFAFFACQHLELEGDTFTLPESLEILGSDAFCFKNNTNITKLVFKKNIKQINVHAFYTNDVTEIWFEGNEPPASYNITGEGEGATIVSIGETRRTIKIYVPQNSVNKYNKKFKKLDGSKPQYVDELDSTYLYKRTWNASITSADESTRYEITYDKDDNIIHKINHLQRYHGTWNEIDGIKYIYATYIYPDKATNLMGRNSKYYEFIGY